MWHATVKKQIEASQAGQKTDEIDQTTLPGQNTVSLSSSSSTSFTLTHVNVPNQEKRRKADFSLQTHLICNVLLAGLLSCVNLNCFKVYQKD